MDLVLGLVLETILPRTFLLILGSILRIIPSS